MTGNELMDVLSEEFGIQWSPVTYSTGTSMSSVIPDSLEPARIEVIEPFGGAANVYVVAGVDVSADSEVARLFDRVTQMLAPDVSAWIADALDQGLATEATFRSARETATGGRVSVLVFREIDLTDWISVGFSP